MSKKMSNELMAAYVGIVFGQASKAMSQTYAIVEEAGFRSDPEATTGDKALDLLAHATVPTLSMQGFLQSVDLFAMMHGVDPDDEEGMLDVAASVSKHVVETSMAIQSRLVERAAANGGKVATALKMSQMIAGAIQTGVRPGDGTIH